MFTLLYMSLYTLGYFEGLYKQAILSWVEVRAVRKTFMKLLSHKSVLREMQRLLVHACIQLGSSANPHSISEIKSLFFFFYTCIWSRCLERKIAVAELHLQAHIWRLFNCFIGGYIYTGYLFELSLTLSKVRGDQFRLSFELCFISVLKYS